MATLNVKGVQAVGFPVDTTVTAPDGNTYVAIANQWYGVPYNQGDNMTVTPAGDAMCMLTGKHLTRSSGQLLQVMTVDAVRTSV